MHAQAKVREGDGIQRTRQAYDAQCPAGRSVKATRLIEDGDPGVRRAALGGIKCIEQKVWIQVEGSGRVFPIADEDLERENDEKTSAVHFLRWELTEEMAAALKYGVSLSMGDDHPHYAATVSPLAQDTRSARVADLR